jgi:hypothetical protein
MLALEFFTWWYGQGWSLLAQNAKHRIVRTSHLFSLPILIRTLFAPWKRITSQPGAGLEAHVHAATDNLVSRCIGFVVRIFVLFAAIVILIIIAVIAVFQIIAWPLLPPAVIACVIKGIL